MFEIEKPKAWYSSPWFIIAIIVIIIAAVGVGGYLLLKGEGEEPGEGEELGLPLYPGSRSDIPEEYRFALDYLENHYLPEGVEIVEYIVSDASDSEIVDWYENHMTGWIKPQPGLGFTVWPSSSFRGTMHGSADVYIKDNVKAAGVWAAEVWRMVGTYEEKLEDTIYVLAVGTIPAFAELTWWEPPLPPGEWGILIDGNNEFTPANGVVAGNGTASDPYIIENQDIDAFGAHGIHIKNTTVYFIIRNCYVYGGRTYDFDGIRLENVINSRIENVRAENNAYGIKLEHSEKNIISNNIVRNNSFNGIDLGYSNNNTISNNITKSNTYGLELDYSDNNTISNNVAGNNYMDGIHLGESSNNLVSNNITENTSYFGIRLYGSDNNLVLNNTARNNKYGIAITTSDNNTILNNIMWSNTYGIWSDTDNTRIYHNDFVNNTNQAYDEGANYWDDGYPSGGNYWSDYTGEDTDNDGIGDIPYNIPGGTNQDRYPLMNPV